MAEIDVALHAAVPEQRGADHEDELRSLLRWVRADENLEGRVDGGVRPTPAGPGEMGLAFDVLQLALGTGISLGALAVSVLQWLEARADRSRPVVVLRRGGTEVELPATADVDPAVLARLLAPLLGVPQPAAAMPAAAPAPPPPAPVPTPAPVAPARSGTAAGGPAREGPAGGGSARAACEDGAHREAGDDGAAS